MKDIDKKSIEFTKEQYEILAKTVYLGNWMANANRTGSSDDPYMEKYQKITDYIFSLASEFGFSKHFEHDLECDETNEKKEVNQLHEKYDEVTFWDELSEILGERDFYIKYTDEERKKMDRDEHFIKLQECIIAWDEEFKENGVERLYSKDDA